MGIQNELMLCNIGLRHNEPQRFVTSQWGHSRLYLTWRILWALFHTSWLVTSLVVAMETMTSPPLGVAVWFIYLSNWTYLLLTISTILDAVIVLYVKVRRQDILKGLSPHLPWYMRISWLFNSVVTEGSLHISAFYWIFVFKDQEFTVLRFIFHGVNSIYVLSNLLLTAMPIRVYHVIYPVIYGVIYTVFSVVYHMFGGTNVLEEPYIYKVLDWAKWKRTLPLVCLSTFVVLPCLYVMIYFIHLLRGHVYSSCHKLREEVGTLESSSEKSNNDLDYV